MRRTLHAIVVLIAVAGPVAGCSDEGSTGSERFPGLTTTAEASGRRLDRDTTTTAETTTTVPPPGWADANALVDSIFEGSGATPSSRQRSCLANEILDRITADSLPGIRLMTQDQYPPGLADDLNAALIACLPEGLLGQVVI